MTSKPHKEKGNSFLSIVDFEHEVEKASQAIESNSDGSLLSLELSTLLQEFQDITPKEIPFGIPPNRGIHDCIDLVPGIVLLNKTACRMSSKEHKKLKRQVNELVTKGLVRKSVSPCVIPALLVPKKDVIWNMH